MFYVMNFSSIADTQSTANLLVPELQSIIDGFSGTGTVKSLNEVVVYVSFSKRFLTEPDAFSAKTAIETKLSEPTYISSISAQNFMLHECNRPTIPECPPPTVMP